ncbi:hypothetical protein [Teredinibacter franksiae]|uniref:hypothetical protein n=1 Tax=Teredinibacter franksiae TaxID=2761453 RepID=UPI0016295C42|nr:hypothetical protein [Teredinibacter franksiae]
MMTESEYLYAWLYYLIGAGLLIACWWYITRRIPWLEVRFMLRLVVSVAILVPWYTNTQQEYLSPAILIAAVELFFEGSTAFWRAGMPLLTALVVALALSTLGFTVRWFLLRRKLESSTDSSVEA